MINLFIMVVCLMCYKRIFVLGFAHALFDFEMLVSILASVHHIGQRLLMEKMVYKSFNT